MEKDEREEEEDTSEWNEGVAHDGITIWDWEEERCVWNEWSHEKSSEKFLNPSRHDNAAAAL